MGKHAVLSPSASERWINCPASVKLAAQFPNESSRYAEEGTLAHELGEIKAAYRFGLIDKPTFRRREKAFIRKLGKFLGDVEEVIFEETLAEMDRHTDAYVELIAERLAAHPHSQLMLEQRLETGVDECDGTSDAETSQCRADCAAATDSSAL